MNYHAPTSIAETVHLLSKGATPIAGGTDWMVQVRAGRRQWPEALVSLARIEGLSGVSHAADGIVIGALTTHTALIDSAVIASSYPSLVDAAGLVGSPATRCAGTIGGNLCNASPAMDLGAPLLVNEARLRLVGPNGERTVAVDNFLTGPGRTALRAGELLAEVLLPSYGSRSACCYVRLGYRNAMEIAVVGAAARVTLDATGRCSEARIALSAVAPRCVRVPEADALLQGATPDEETIEAAAHAATAVSSPIDDLRATAAYRSAMIPVIAGRAIRLALARAGGRQAGA